MTEGLLPIALISKQHHKIKYFFESHGWEDCLIFVDSDKSIKDQLEKLIKNSPDILARNFNSLQKLQLEAQNFIEKLGDPQWKKR